MRDYPPKKAFTARQLQPVPGVPTHGFSNHRSTQISLAIVTGAVEGILSQISRSTSRTSPARGEFAGSERERDRMANPPPRSRGAHVSAGYDPMSQYRSTTSHAPGAPVNYFSVFDSTVIHVEHDHDYGDDARPSVIGSVHGGAGTIGG